MSAIRQIRYRQVTRAMRTVFATSLGRKSVATSVLVKVILTDGEQGEGEVPTSFVLPHETPEAIKSILDQAARELAGAAIDDYPDRLARLRGRFGDFHMTLSGLEVALFRAQLAARGAGEHAFWGGMLCRLETDITVPFLPRRPMREAWLRRIAPVGFTAYKVKVSGDVEKDIRFVRAVRRTLLGSLKGPFVIRLDGNQGYTARTYLRMLDRLEREGIEIELFEQPLKQDDFAGYRRIRGRSRAPLVLDETVFTAADCRRVIEQGLGDGVNIKIAKSGIAESGAILKMAKAAGLKLMIGCMTETMVGLSAGILMAAGTGAFDYVDLDSAHLLHADRRRRGIVVDGRSYVIEGA